MLRGILMALTAMAALGAVSACAETYGGGSVAGALPTAALVPGVPQIGRAHV